MISPYTPPDPRQARQQGGVAILVVFSLLCIMTVGAIGLSRTSLRDLAISGNEGTGRKAAEAADSAVDWVITWANPSVAFELQASQDADGNNTSTLVNQTLTGAPALIQANMNQLLAAVGDDALRVAGDDPLPNTPAGGSYGLLSNQTGSLRFFLRSVDYSTTSAPELFQTGYTSGSEVFLQASQVQQSFDTEIRFLGESFTARTSSVKAKSTGGLFLIRTTGRAAVLGTPSTFIARREVLVDYVP